MEEVFTINKTGILEFENNRFKVNNNNNKLKSAGECIADYITLSIHSFIKKYDYLGGDRTFIFVFNDRTSSDSFLEAKHKIELFSYNFDDNGCFKRFTIDFIKLIKSIEEHLCFSQNFKKKDHLTYVYNYRGLTFTSNFNPYSNTRLVRLDYKSNKLAEFSEYMEFGIKIIEYVHPIFSNWHIEIKGYEYRLYVYLILLELGIKMDSVTIGWLSKLEKYVVSHI